MMNKIKFQFTKIASQIIFAVRKLIPAKLSDLSVLNLKRKTKICFKRTVDIISKIKNRSKSFIKNTIEKTKLICQKLTGSIGQVFYINGSETLPPPLSKSEEAKIMERISAGDESAREPLIVHNLRLVVYIAKKFESSGICVEDLVSIGTIGLIKAVNTFSPGKNIKLATYASRCIENEILMFLRKTSHRKNEISIDEPLNTDWDGNELLLCDVLGSDSDVINRNIEQELEQNLLLDAVKNLPPREKTIMELRFGINNKKEHTQKEVADMLGISQSYISRLEKKIINRLKKELDRTINC